jgi:hypothetical protein
MENSYWEIENGYWEIENGYWKTENSYWKIENGYWETENCCLKMLIKISVRLFMKLCLQRRKTKFADYDRTD